MNRNRLIVLLILAFSIGMAVAHEDDAPPQGKPPERLGKVHFAVTCNDAAQKEFNRAMALFHSFWFDPAKQSFAKVLELDAQCAMAQLGHCLHVDGQSLRLAR